MTDDSTRSRLTRRLQRMTLAERERLPGIDARRADSSPGRWRYFHRGERAQRDEAGDVVGAKMQRERERRLAACLAPSVPRIEPRARGAGSIEPISSAPGLK